LELVNVLQEVLLPKSEVLLRWGRVESLVGLEVERVHEELLVFEEVAPE
jgi:hypothetical protein